MKVLVTGASGFVGRHVVSDSIKRGHSVRALVRGTSKKTHLEGHEQIEVAFGAVEDAASVAKAVEGVDAIIHCAGVLKALNAREFHRTNVDGTRNVLDAIAASKSPPKRFVFVSSLAAAGPSSDGQPVSPDAKNPVTEYGRSKLAAEALVRTHRACGVTIVRPPPVYGPWDVEFLEMFRSVARGTVPMGPVEKTSMVYVADVASALVMAAEKELPHGKAYFVDDGVPHAIDAVITEIERTLGVKPARRIRVPKWVMSGVFTAYEVVAQVRRRPTLLSRDKLNEFYQKSWVCSSDELRRDLGWASQTSLADGFAMTARWYRENGLLKS